MHINVSEQNNRAVVQVSGRLDAVTTPDLEKELDAILKGRPRQAVLDFSGLDYVSSAGLRAVLAFTKNFGLVGGKVALCGLKMAVAQVFSLTGISDLVPLYDDLPSALT